jgi:hypothetical protein
MSERKEFLGKAQAAVRHVRGEGVKRALTYIAKGNILRQWMIENEAQ